jgi:phosphate transport system substrate-binding protein
MKRKVFLTCAAASIMACLAALTLNSCSKGGDKSGDRPRIRTGGSTTLLPVVGGWAEAYEAADVSVSGGGSSAGLKDLLEGRVDIANSSRPMKDTEKAEIKSKTGKDVKETIVGYDALAIFVHKDNPATQISLGQLNQIYSSAPKEGKPGITKWEELGAGSGEIRVLGREHSSGTGEYFQEAVCGKEVKFREGISELNSAAAVISTLGNTKNAIAYDALAFKTDSVKALAVSKKDGEAPIAPSAEGARNLSYPLARKLYLYSVGEPEGIIKTYLDWTVSEAGQKILAAKGSVPLK